MAKANTKKNETSGESVNKAKKPAGVPQKRAAKTAKTARKKEVKEHAPGGYRMVFQYQGRDYEEEAIMAGVRDTFVNDMGHDIDEMRSLNVYLKPEDNKCYFVVNEDIKGEFDI